MIKQDSITTKCARCSNEFEHKPYRARRYCSRTCAVSANNESEPKRKKLVVLYCVVCLVRLLGNRRLYCSEVCKQSSKDKFITEWLSGQNTGSQPNGKMQSKVRKFLLEECKNCCSRCGWGEINPVLGYAILTIDHIDGNWKNNQRSNVVVLCYNCHSLTPTFGALNKGNGAGIRGTYSRVAI